MQHYGLNYWTAVSALIKSFRLRRRKEVIAYAIYLAENSNKWYPHRRIAIMSGEDGLSLGAVKAATLLNSKSTIEEQVRVLLMMGSTPNWWGVEEGREYITHYARLMKAGLVDEAREAKNKLHGLKKALDADDSDRVLVYAEAASANAFKETAFLLFRKAKQLHRPIAAEHATLCLKNSTLLRGDINHIDLTARRLYFDLPSATPRAVTSVDVQEGLDAGRAKLAKILETGVPEYYCDGHHTSVGKDKRFAGIPIYMLGCCRAYEHYGRLDPRDAWQPNFMKV